MHQELAPETADGTSAERAFPVRDLAIRLRDYIARLGRVWVQGQVVQVNRRAGGAIFLTLRDESIDASVDVMMAEGLERSLTAPLIAGQQVLMQVRCEYWVRSGRLTLRAQQVRAVGVGALLIALERRKQQLAAEGLFAAQLKRPLPLLPRRIGLITGVNADARHDVVRNAQLRWPGVQFEVREGFVQGAQAVSSVISALHQLDGQLDVEVIVIARGGGSLEDLLPFSDESLIRAVAAAQTPVVSAIGHEQDNPLLDLVADVRASTPTDAGRLIVPDWADEVRRITDRRNRIRLYVRGRIDQERTWLEQTRSRPAMADPAGFLPKLQAEITGLQQRSFRSLDHRIDLADRELAQIRARARALSPLATLDRGYAIVKAPDGGYVRSADSLVAGDEVRVRVATGHFSAKVGEVTMGSMVGAS